MQVIISGVALQSAHLCTAKGDIRYYLNNVYVEWNEKTTRVVSTTGHYMYLNDEEPTINNNTGSGSLLIPREVLDRVKPTSSGTFAQYVLTAEPMRVENERTIYNCTLRKLTDTTTTAFVSGEGVFADYTRVIPSFAAFDLLRDGSASDENNTVLFAPDIYGKPCITVDAVLAERLVKRFECREEVASFNFDYLTIAMKVQRVHHGKNAKSPRLYQNGTYAASLIKFADNAYMVIMSMRHDEGHPPVLDSFKTRVEQPKVEHESEEENTQVEHEKEEENTQVEHEGD